jgi:hypothetical protein
MFLFDEATEFRVYFSIWLYLSFIFHSRWLTCDSIRQFHFCTVPKINQYECLSHLYSIYWKQVEICFIKYKLHAAGRRVACVQPLLSTKRARERLWVGCIILVQVTWIFPRFGDRRLIGQRFIWIICDKWSYFIG